MTVDISVGAVLFFVLYGVTGMAAFMAALYLLLRRGNAFAPEVTPPLRLRRWAASFFAMSLLGHVWWCLLFISSGDSNLFDGIWYSSEYVAVVVLDCLTLLPTIAGTLLAMLQDRRRPVWPILLAMIPFVALGAVLMVRFNVILLHIAGVYVLLLYILFTIYIIFAVRQYGRWLRDNYADLERKEVWLSQIVALACMLFFILYAVIDGSAVFLYLLHAIELVFFGLLLWRVETLPQLGESSMEQSCCTSALDKSPDTAVVPQTESPSAIPSNTDFPGIEKLLAECCEATQLYLQHELTVGQLAKAVGTNRFYLSQYFSRQGTTYNAYINDLRIRHFVSLYRKAVSSDQSVTAQQLARESGYRSYSTFSLAFKQRMGQSVTAWMRDEHVNPEKSEGT